MNERQSVDYKVLNKEVGKRETNEDLVRRVGGNIKKNKLIREEVNMCRREVGNGTQVDCPSSSSTRPPPASPHSTQCSASQQYLFIYHAVSCIFHHKQLDVCLTFSDLNVTALPSGQFPMRGAKSEQILKSMINLVIYSSPLIHVHSLRIYQPIIIIKVSCGFPGRYHLTLWTLDNCRSFLNWFNYYFNNS